MINYFKYYFNILSFKTYRKYVIKYDDFSYSDFFDREHKYAGKLIHTCDDTNRYIIDKIKSGVPFMLARYGSTELYNMEVFDLNLRNKYRTALDMLCHYSGFFPNEIEKGKKFCDLMKISSYEVDVQAVWNIFMEEHYVAQLMPKAYLTQLRFIEPWFSVTNPWTEALEGKKVLVIHPFTDTIEEQYKKRTLLFKDKRILPEFELITLKAVQTLGGQSDERFDTWFDALDYMYKKACLLDFDIALIGCGAYGFPLAALLKKQGKQAFHMGGVLQVLFGIKGARWDSDPHVSTLYNEYWVRPSEKERIKKSDSIEGGCYW